VNGYPKHAKRIIDAALAAGWSVHAGPDDCNGWTLKLYPRSGVRYTARWRRRNLSWVADYAEKRTANTADEVTLAELRAAIGGPS
jgi:hypothetical protein